MTRNYSALPWRRYRVLLLVVMALGGCATARQTQPGDARATPADSTLPTPAPAGLVPKGPVPPATEFPVTVDPPRQEAVSPPAPTAPLSADQLLALAIDQRRAGEPEPMAATLELLLSRAPAPPLRRQAEFYLAEAHLQAGRPVVASEAFSAFVAVDLADEWRARATFLLGRANEAAGQYAEAVSAYREYRSLNTLLAPYAALREAAQHEALGDTTAMLKAYEQAAAHAISPPAKAELLETLVRLYEEGEQPEAALARYRELLDLARKPEYRAGLLLRAARLAGAMGDQDQQQAWLRDIVEDHPQSVEALSAIRDLESAGATVDPYQAGQVAFGHEQYAEATERLTAALAAELPTADRFEARRLRALALRGVGDFDRALAELGDLAQGGGASAAGRQAELDYVQTVGQAGNQSWAIDGYRRFAINYPDDPLAPEALWRAIQLEEASDPAAAMAAALDLGRLFRATDQAHAALNKAAVYFRNQGQLAEAIRAWQMLGEGASGWDAAEGRFWAAMTLIEGGERDAGLEQMRLAADAAPESYYASRAREFLGRNRPGPAGLGSPIGQAERRAVETWLAEWTGREVSRVDDNWLPEIANSREVLRARELGMLSLDAEAREEWLYAIERWTDEPEHLWQLGLLASIEHEPHVAIRAAERLVKLSPAGRIAPNTPSGILRLLFPTPYTRVIRQEAKQFGFDPRVLYSVLRQESLFSPSATSWVGARGLGQVMPATAAGIAAELGIEGFDPDWLYRPAVSVRFGAFYLGRQLRAYDGSVQAAAAAYNGGPSNAARWLDLSTHPDRFTELIDYRETRDYVKIVYGNLGMYSMLYAE